MDPLIDLKSILIPSKLLLDSCGVKYRQVGEKAQKVLRVSLKPDEPIEYLEK